MDPDFDDGSLISPSLRRVRSVPHFERPTTTQPLSSTEASVMITTSPQSTEFSSVDETIWIKPNKSRAQYDCNICFDNAREPVVTQCGHLYCWPCLHEWLSSPSIAADPTCPTCKSGCEIPSVIPIYGRGPSTPPRVSSPSPTPHRSPSPSSSSQQASRKVPRALRFADIFLLPYLKPPSSTTKPPIPPRPQAKRLPPRSILQNSPFYMLIQSAQRHYAFLPEGTVLVVPQSPTTPRFGRPHLFMLVFAIWAALFKMMADSGRSWRSFSAFDAMGSVGGSRMVGMTGVGAEGDMVGRFGLILGMFLGFGLLWYRSRHM